jgi:arylformamidase
MTIDFEVEYDNRGRVPEHPEILARAARLASAYREAMIARHRADLDVSYGPTSRQIVDVFRSDAGEAAPVVVFIHGGYWRALEPSAFSHVAAGLNARGMTVALAGYDLCPQVTIAAIIDEIRQACLYLWRRLGRRMLVIGHSAGGHLAATTLATDWQKFGVPADLVPAAVSISGLFDLKPLIHTSMNADLRLDDAEAQRVSPLLWPAPQGRKFDAIVGGAESSEFIRQSRAIAETWGKAGVATRFEAVPGANHFTVIEPLADPDSAMVERLTELVPSL